MTKYTPSSKVYERYMDASIELFMECYAETISVASSADIQEPEAPELNKKCKALIKATHRRQKLLGFTRSVRRVLKSAAVLAIAILSLSSVFFVTVEAVRTPILNFYIEKNDGNWKLSNKPFEPDLTNLEHSAPEAGFNEDNPLEYLLPDGFTLRSVKGSLDDSLIAVYYNEENKTTIFEYRNADSSIRVNTDDAAVTQLKISGYDAVISSQESTNSLLLIWYNSDINCTLSLQTDHLTKDDLIAIAESINYALMY